MISQFAMRRILMMLDDDERGTIYRVSRAFRAQYHWVDCSAAYVRALEAKNHRLARELWTFGSDLVQCDATMLLLLARHCHDAPVIAHVYKIARPQSMLSELIETAIAANNATALQVLPRPHFPTEHEFLQWAVRVGDCSSLINLLNATTFLRNNPAELHLIYHAAVTNAQLFDRVLQITATVLQTRGDKEAVYTVLVNLAMQRVRLHRMTVAQCVALLSRLLPCAREQLGEQWCDVWARGHLHTAIYDGCVHVAHLLMMHVDPRELALFRIHLFTFARHHHECFIILLRLMESHSLSTRWVLADIMRGAAQCRRLRFLAGLIDEYIPPAQLVLAAIMQKNAKLAIDVLKRYNIRRIDGDIGQVYTALRDSGQVFPTLFPTLCCVELELTSVLPYLLPTVYCTTDLCRALGAAARISTFETVHLINQRLHFVRSLGADRLEDLS